MVCDVETPLVVLELQERAQSEDADEVVASFAGDYVNLPIRQLRLPSRVLLDEPQNHAGRGFSIDSGDPRCAKATLLECTCGTTECWFLLAQIAVLEDVVVWTSFEQFHRDWVYDLGPFVFDKADYLHQLR